MVEVYVLYIFSIHYRVPWFISLMRVEACVVEVYVYILYTVPPFISLMRVEVRVVEIYVCIYYTLQSPFIYKFDESGSACG